MKTTIYISIFIFTFTLFSFHCKQGIAQPGFSWARMMSSHSNSGAFHQHNIEVDNDGNVYNSGIYSGTVDFDPGPGVFNMSSGVAYAMYLSKLDSSGNFIWAKQFMGQIGGSIRLTSSGQLIVVGSIDGTIDLDPGPAIYNLTGPALYVCKLDSAGDFLWAKQTGGFAGGGGGSVIDDDGNILITGNFLGTVDFDPGVGVASLTFTSVLHDHFVLKLDSMGNYIWVKGMQGTSDAMGYSIAVDASGLIFLTGSFIGTVDFDPGVGVYYLNSTSIQDIFIQKLDSQGNFIWAKKMGGSNGDFGKSIGLDNQSNIYTTGQFAPPVDFDPGPGVYNLTSGYSFIQKMDSAGNFIWAKPISTSSSSNSFVSTSFIDTFGNIYSTGLFGSSNDFDPGAGVYNLVAVGGINVFIQKLDSAGNFIWATRSGEHPAQGQTIIVNNGNVFTSGSFDDTSDFDPGPGVFNLGGPGTTQSFIQKLHQCINSNTSLTIKPCNSYTFNSTTYTTSGTYIDTFSNSIGCDSFVTLHLQITSLNDSVTMNGPTLTAFYSGSFYQWVDCNNGFAMISGATNQSYTPSSFGTYAVIITESGCVDTSKCFTVWGLGLEDIDQPISFTIHPNPGNGVFEINMPGMHENVSYKITDATGRIILQKDHQKGHRFSLDISKFSTGIYIITINVGEKYMSRKLIKK